MSIQKVSSANSINFNGNQTNNKNNTTVEFQNNVQDGKKKLALALGGLAVVSVVTLSLYKTGKLNGIIDSLKQLKVKNKPGNSNEDLIKNFTKFTEFDTKKPESAIKNNPLMEKPSIQGEVVARIEAQAKADEIAQQAQEKFNKPFEDKLANKSAEESAAVFTEEHNAKIQSEALSRLKQERDVKQAQEVQNKLIETIQNPSGMSKAEKQTLVDSLENKLVEQDIKSTSKTTKTLEWIEDDGRHRIVEIEVKGKLAEPQSVSQVHYYPRKEISEDIDIHYDLTFNPHVDPEKRLPFDDISYVSGDKKYTFDYNTGNKKLKIKQADGTFKTIQRENEDKVVWHLEDGTTQVLDKHWGE